MPFGHLAEHQPAQALRELGALVDPVDDGEAGLGRGLDRVQRRRLARASARAGRLSSFGSGIRNRSRARSGAGADGSIDGSTEVSKRDGYRYWPMPSSGSTRVARREPLQLGVDRVARAEIDVAVAHERVEAVERAHRRAAGDLAAEVVDAAVARADEALGGLDVADRAAEVHAPRRQRDVVVQLVVRLGVDRRVALAHVGDRLAGLADALRRS